VFTNKENKKDTSYPDPLVLFEGQISAQQHSGHNHLET
jgi:hypothetical protein